MKSSNVIYKILTFLILNILVIFLLLKLVSLFFSYKNDWSLFKKKFESIKNKKEGTFYNHLNYPVFSANDPSYLKSINLDFLIYNLRCNNKASFYSYGSFLISFIFDNSFSILSSKPIYLEKADEYFVINKFLTEQYITYNKRNKIPYIITHFICFSKIGNALSLIYNFDSMHKIQDEDAQVFTDSSINLRVKKYCIKDCLPIFTSILFNKNERLNFLYSPELGLRLFYDPKEFSNYEIRELINSLKIISEGEIKNYNLEKVVNIGDKYYYVLFNNLAYQLDLDLNLNKNRCFDLAKNGLIVYFLAINKIKDFKLIKEFCDNIDNKDYRLSQNSLIIPINIKNLKEENLKKAFPLYYFLLFSNDEAFKIIQKLNECKNKNIINYLDCNIGNNFNKYKIVIPYSLKKLLNYYNVNEVYNYLKKEIPNLNFELFKIFLRKITFYYNLKIEKNRIKIPFLEKEKEIKNSLIIDLNKIKNHINKIRTKEDLKKLILKINEFEQRDDQLVNFLRENEAFLNTINFNYYILTNKEIKNYLNSNVYVEPYNSNLLIPSLVMKVYSIKRKQDKWTTILLNE